MEIFLKLTPLRERLPSIYRLKCLAKLAIIWKNYKHSTPGTRLLSDKLNTQQHRRTGLSVYLENHQSDDGF